jgi:hypothetical protein
VDSLINLDEAVIEIFRRVQAWEAMGLLVGPVTWRDQSEGWPPPFKTERSVVGDADSIGVRVQKGTQEGSVVLFRGGWADLEYWSGEVNNEPIVEAPGWEEWLTVERFGQLLDRFVAMFR